MTPASGRLIQTGPLPEIGMLERALPEGRADRPAHSRRHGRARAARQEGHVDFASRGAGRAGRWPEGAAGGQEYGRRKRGSLASATILSNVA